jgi:hypothetical protein
MKNQDLFAEFPQVEEDFREISSDTLSKRVKKKEDFREIRSDTLSKRVKKNKSQRNTIRQTFGGNTSSGTLNRHVTHINMLFHDTSNVTSSMDTAQNSVIGAPKASAENHDCYRRFFNNDQILLPSAIMATISGLECFIVSWLFEEYNLREVAESDEIPFALEKTPFLVAASLASFMVVFRAQICYNR